MIRKGRDGNQAEGKHKRGFGLLLQPTTGGRVGWVFRESQRQPDIGSQTTKVNDGVKTALLHLQPLAASVHQQRSDSSV